MPIRAWTKNVPLEGAAQKQLSNVTSLPFIYKWAAWAQNYALENRELMMANIISGRMGVRAGAAVLDGPCGDPSLGRPAKRSERLRCEVGLHSCLTVNRGSE